MFKFLNSLVVKLQLQKNKFEMWFAQKQAAMLSSMWFYYVCLSLDIIELTLQPPHSVQEWIQFLAQTVIQLLALPVLAFVSDLSTSKILKYLEDMWNWLKEMHDWLKESHDWQKESHNKIIEEFGVIKEIANNQKEEISLLKEELELLHKTIKNKSDT